MKRLAVLAAALLLVPAVAFSAPTQVTQAAKVSPNGAPSILIPPSSIGIDLCLGEGSGAYATSMLAITLSGPQRDMICSVLRQSKWAADLQHVELAYQIMCASPDWRSADAVTDRLCKAKAPKRPRWRFW